MVNGRIRKNQEQRHRRSVPDRLYVEPSHRTHRPGNPSGVVDRIRYPRPMAKRRSRYHGLEITKL